MTPLTFTLRILSDIVAVTILIYILWLLTT